MRWQQELAAERAAVVAMQPQMLQVMGLDADATGRVLEHLGDEQ